MEEFIFYGQAPWGLDPGRQSLISPGRRGDDASVVKEDEGFSKSSLMSPAMVDRSECKHCRRDERLLLVGIDRETRGAGDMARKEVRFNGFFLTFSPIFITYLI